MTIDQLFFPFTVCLIGMQLDMRQNRLRTSLLDMGNYGLLKCYQLSFGRFSSSFVVLFIMSILIISDINFIEFLQNKIDCTWLDAREVLIVNPVSSNQVDPDFQESESRLDKWFSRRPCKTIVATGFIASTRDNIPTTLKRDGSDFSAAIMGALFRARQVTIWTDVDGVFSADPRKGMP